VSSPAPSFKFKPRPDDYFKPPASASFFIVLEIVDRSVVADAFQQLDVMSAGSGIKFHMAMSGTLSDALKSLQDPTVVTSRRESVQYDDDDDDTDHIRAKRKYRTRTDRTSVYSRMKHRVLNKNGTPNTKMSVLNLIRQLGGDVSAYKMQRESGLTPDEFVRIARGLLGRLTTDGYLTHKSKYDGERARQSNHYDLTEEGDEELDEFLEEMKSVTTVQVQQGEQDQ
jgi:hypothetical protein